MENTTESTNDLVIERTLRAPIEKVWNMWAEAEMFKQWYGPDGATIPTANMDVVVGGKRLICMEMNTPNGPMQMWFGGEYLEVNPTSLLTYTEYMSDKDGALISPADIGMPQDHPETTTIRVELNQKGNVTELSMKHIGVAQDSPGAAGWIMAINKLEKMLG